MNKVIYSLLQFFFFAVVLHHSSISQALFKVSMDEKVMNAVIIVEGKVVEKNAFWNTAHTMIYTANKIKVYKYFKGTAVADYIEVMTVGGSVGYESIEASDLLAVQKNDAGIFFCYPNNLNIKTPGTNNLLWEVYSSGQGFLRYDLNAKIADAPFAKYDNIASSLYPELELKTGNKFTVIDNGFNITASPNSPAAPTAAVITSFSPTTVAAGATIDVANNLLTINGTGFGPASGAAAVLFDDADNGNGGTPFSVPFNDPLIVSWSATQIQVRVPSKAGTGTFQVVDNTGAASPASAVLTVSYSILTATFTSGSTVTKESNLMNNNGNGGYSIVYSTNTAGGGVDLNASPTKITFQRALNTWKEISGYNVLENGTTTVQAVAPDGLNIIMFDNTNTGFSVLPNGVLAVCYSWQSMCPPVTVNAVQKTEFDIVLRNPGVSTGAVAFTTGPCFPSTSTTEFDLETVILHELGHSLNLGHINDGFEGSFLPNINPNKVMHFAVVNGVDRRSPDWSAKTGAAYVITPQGNTYGVCLALAEMTPLATIIESKDECPGTFPATATPSGTVVAFDLEHATSNKNTDPQYTAINCAGTGAMVTNTAFYAIKTNATGGILTITVSGYATIPATQAACSGAGIQLALYQTAVCPAGQAYPAPVACRTFNADGGLANFTGLAANTNYLIMVTGLSNTKAVFSLALTGAAVLPVKIVSFNGNTLAGKNALAWKVDNIFAVEKMVLEGSIDGVFFTELYTQEVNASTTALQGSFSESSNAAVKYYRLKVFNKNGSIEYSNIIALKQDGKNIDISFSPNPARDKLTVTLFKKESGMLFFKLLDVSGKIIAQEKQLLSTAGAQSLQLNIINGIAAGTYFIEIKDGEKKTTKKIIVY